MSEWIVSEKRLNLNQILKYESIMYQGNGYMGVRNSFEEAYTNERKNLIVNGTFNAPIDEVPELPSFPDVLNCEICINGENFTMLSGEVTEYKRKLDMKTGESIRSLVWISPKGVRVGLKFRRIVSQDKKHIIAQKIEITPYSAARISIVSGIDGKVTNSGVQHFYDIRRRMYPENRIGLYFKTTRSKVIGAITCSVKCDKKHEYMVFEDRRGIYSKLEFSLSEKECAAVEKISSVASTRDFEYRNCDEVDFEKLRLDGAAYLEEAVKTGYDALFEESKNYWESFWKENAVVIKSDNVFEQNAANFSLYHLHIMANREDNRVGVGAKGLSGERYKGHSFWDTEIFVLPYYIFNAPKTARNLLEYRYKLLKTSCEKAKKYGYDGAMYPWEAAWIDDGEACPEMGAFDMITGVQRRNLMGELEIHISADVAYGVWQYYCATGDDEFMEKYGYEMIILTAIFWTSRAVLKNGRLEILNVIGPDEYKDSIDNNAYTNYMAYFNVKLAGKILNKIPGSLKEKLEYNLDELKNKFSEFLAKIYLPKKNEKGLINQFDGYLDLEEIPLLKYKDQEKVGLIFNDYSYNELQKLQVGKQADLVMLFYLLEDMFDDEDIRRNFEYYEARTLHDSSLSMCIHALVAARLGMDKMADKLFLDCCSVDLGENVNNSDEGIHSASIGGIWLALVMGYAGMRMTESGLSFTPDKRKGKYSFPILYKGRKLHIDVDENDCRITRQSGEKIKISVYGEERMV